MKHCFTIPSIITSRDPQSLMIPIVCRFLIGLSFRETPHQFEHALPRTSSWLARIVEGTRALVACGGLETMGPSSSKRLLLCGN